DQPRRAIISLASMTSARLQGIPSAIARELAAESKPAVCEAVVRREIWRALEDLADSADRAEAKLQKEEAAADSGSPLASLGHEARAPREHEPGDAAAEKQQRARLRDEVQVENPEGRQYFRHTYVDAHEDWRDPLNRARCRRRAN